MFRYVACIWNDQDSAAREAAQTLLQRHSASGQDWRVALRGSGAEVRYVEQRHRLQQPHISSPTATASCSGISSRARRRESPRRRRRTSGRPTAAPCSTATAAISSRASGDATSLSSTMRRPARPGWCATLRAALPCYLVRCRGVDIYFSWIDDIAALLDAPLRGQLALPHRGRQLPARALPWNRPARGQRRFSPESASRRVAASRSASSTGIRCRSPTPRSIEDLGAAVAAHAAVRARCRPCVGVLPRSRAVLAFRRPRLLDRARVSRGRAVAAAGDLLPLLSPRRRPRRARVRARRRREGGTGVDRAQPRLFLQPAAAAHHPPRAGADPLRLFPGAQPARRAARRRAWRHRDGDRAWRRSALLSGARRVGARGFPPPPRAAARRAARGARCRADGSGLLLARAAAGRRGLFRGTGAGAFCRRRDGCGRCSCRR